MRFVSIKIKTTFLVLNLEPKKSLTYFSEKNKENNEC